MTDEYLEAQSAELKRVSSEEAATWLMDQYPVEQSRLRARVTSASQQVVEENGSDTAGQVLFSEDPIC